MALFDGVAGLLSDVFGDPVTYLPQAGGTQSVVSVFRRQPTEGVDSDGHPVLILAPTWRVRSDLVPGVKRGDQIRPGDGRLYEVMNVQPSGSPGSDAFFICELYEVE